MRWANLEDSEQVDATKLKETDREDYRGRLRCPDAQCNTVLHWRKRSRDGKAATFFGNHEETCSHGTKTETLEIASQEEEIHNARSNDGRKIKIQFAPHHRTGTKLKDDESSEEATSQRSRRHIGNEEKKHQASVSAKALLRKLVSDPAFRTTSTPLELSDGTATTVAEGCAHVDENPRMGETLLLWGEVKYVRGRFLNTGNAAQKKPAVLIDEEGIPLLLQRERIPTLKDLAGYQFIAEGKLRTSSNGGLYMKIRDSSKTAFLPAIRQVD